MAVTLELAISAIRAGRKNEGRQLLNLLIQQNPNDEQAWLWMSAVVTSDEQRARCLYHVLSINPANALARRGLQLLGIVVSDSRPVQVPRDSQPIHIPNPSQPRALPATASPSTPVPAQNSPPAGRRPFLINPQTITAELPFTPVREPFAAEEKVKPSPAILSLNVEDAEEPPSTPPPAQPAAADTVDVPPKTAPAQAQPELAAAATIGMPATTVAARAAAQASTPVPADAVTGAETAETAPPITEVVTPAEVDTSASPVAPPTAPLPVAAQSSTEASDENLANSAIHSTQTQKMDVPVPEAAATPAPATIKAQPQVPENPPDLPGDAAPVPPVPPAPSRPVPAVVAPPNPAGAAVQPPAPDGVVPPPMETRPSQPIYVNYPDPNFGYPPNPGTPGGNPAFSAMPNQPQPHMPPAGQAFHSNATMGMPMSQYPQYRPPSEPVPVIQPNGQYGLVTFGTPPYGQPGPGMNVHSNQTVLMPPMSEAEARARLEGNHQAIPTASAAAMPLQNGGGWPEPQPWLAAMGQAQPADDFEVEEEEPELNVMAMIIFGTLSITAMGGLGMLVLLILTTPTA